MLSAIAMILLSYLMGSIPTSIIAARMLKGIDIREHGSGNAGATNVFRVLGWKTGLAVLLLDMLKGLIPTVWFAQFGAEGMGWSYVTAQMIAGIFAVFGHIWTVFAGFKGGKGVGTGAGMLIGLAPSAVLICMLVFTVTVALSRFVSLGSILASLTLPLVLFVRHVSGPEPVATQLLIFSLFIPLLILFTHRANIQRLLNGQENKIQFQK